LTEGAEEGYLGGKTAEPFISSSEATGSNKSIVKLDPESHRRWSSAKSSNDPIAF
jgi:hypothetical protein